MNFLRRQAISLLALLMLTAPLTILAQGDAVHIDGSRIVASIVEPISETYAEETGIDIRLEISGTSSGLGRLCNSEIDIAIAARAITSEEAQACADNDIAWVEVPLGFDAVAVITNPASDFAQCLTFTELLTLLGPSATDSITAWNQIRTRWQADPFVLYAPPASDTTHNLLDELLPGDGLRTDLNTQDSAAAVITAIAEDPAGLGFAPLSVVLASDAAINILQLDNLSGNGCVTPERTTVEDGTYPGARGLYLYVNAASLEREAVAGLVNRLLSEDGQTAVDQSGFVTLSTRTATRARANVADGVTGRAFSQVEALFTIPLDVSGSLTAENAAAAYQALDNVTDDFTGAYTYVTVNKTAFGNAAAYRKLCNGEAELAAVTRPATDEEAALCQENGVNLWELPLGHRATVLAVPAESEFAACLTTDQITVLWQNRGEDTATNWNQVDGNFPDLPITIFLPQDGQSWTDFILAASSGQLLNPRRDALEKDNDEQYRLAATANVAGSITYVSYASFQASEADVIPVAVDAGEGCVAPTLAAIRDGSYRLSHPITLVVSRAALAEPAAQSVIWYALRDASRSRLEDAGLILPDEATFAGYREAAVAVFAEAEAAAASAAEATPEATATGEAPGEAPPTEDSGSPPGTSTPPDEGATPASGGS